MTVFNKIREYIFNVSAYPECTDTIEIKQFLEFLKELEQEQGNE